MSKTTTITLRVKPELKVMLIALAEKDKRSLNTTCEIGLENLIAERQKSVGKK